MRTANLSLVNWGGTAACGSGTAAQPRYALSNLPMAPDAFHPHFFRGVGGGGLCSRGGGRGGYAG